ncbi:winged helix-turn-helix domain-containing protein [Larkinella soli]|uniref:winged helix-turn-helix domain-containing protein n=1 Tax=Larkinella soli TaxID=1770527 RepID=UPI000FFB4FEC|nr:winged helix-turn-helix domain-containing protein [Larkinella soli]
MDANQPFLINHRFLVDPSRHCIRDLETQSETRLELRHLKLLIQLCLNKGKLVERIFLIKEVWNNYSSADEALTQGISVLRKILVDKNKELIKTIPKQGYILQAEISSRQPPSLVQGPPDQRKYSRAWFYRIVSGMALLSLLLIFLRPGSIEKEKPDNGKDGKLTSTLPSKPAPTEEDEKRAKHTSPPLGGKEDAKESGSKL